MIPGLGIVGSTRAVVLVGDDDGAASFEVRAERPDVHAALDGIEFVGMESGDHAVWRGPAYTIAARISDNVNFCGRYTVVGEDHANAGRAAGPGAELSQVGDGKHSTAHPA